MMTRRQALKTTALVSAAFVTVPGAIAQIAPAVASAAPTGPFTLPPLPYAFDALEPHIDARTMEIHHDKHHAAYIANLNKAVADYPDVAKKPLEEMLANLNAVPEKIRTAVRNNGGGHYNHSLFWQTMKKGGGGEPKGELAEAIKVGFGSFDSFKAEFTKGAMSIFGSGWTWIQCGPGGLDRLFLRSNPNQDSPLMDHGAIRSATDDVAKPPTLQIIPLLGLDIWEHAYYLKYQNKRADYIAAWWNVVNWDFVAERYAKFSK